MYTLFAAADIVKIYYFRNLLDSSMLAMDQEGEIITHALYDEWGKPLTEARLDGNFAGIDNINNYTGYTYDYLLDIYFAQNRFYNPDTRQFITQDPIKDGMNWYGYCEGNPLTNVDPWGFAKGSFQIDKFVEFREFSKAVFEKGGLVIQYPNSPMVSVSHRENRTEPITLYLHTYRGRKYVSKEDYGRVMAYIAANTPIVAPAEVTGNDNKKLAAWLKNIEEPYLDEDYVIVNGKRVAIKPHSANDGYVTVGYGHALQSDEEAKKYGFTTGTKRSVADVCESIDTQLSSYSSYLDNPAILSFEAAEKLLADDLIGYREKAISFADETGRSYSQNQMDAMTSLVYNGNRAYDPDSLLYYFLGQDKEGALSVLRKADSSGWYNGNPGLLRRRLMEFNIFFNNDYTFFDSDRLSELKNITGF